MQVLIAGENLSDYLAKCHEAFRTGLRALFGARVFGKGYPGYDPHLRTYAQIVRHVFPDGEEPDLVLTDWDVAPGDTHVTLPYEGINDAPGLKALVFGDYWQVTGSFREGFSAFAAENIDILLSYFPQALREYVGDPIASRLFTMFPSIDPAIFHDYHQAKQYDVGFLAAGSLAPDRFYPERFRIHEKLHAMSDIRYLSAPHPGWQRHREHPLVGAGFSRAINSCRLFVTTGSARRHLQPKYVEALSSRTVLLADEPEGAREFGLRDGVNYVRCSERNIVEKVRYYMAHPELCEQIADAGYRLALARHTCFNRAAQMLDIVHAVRRQRASGVRLSAGDGPRLHLGCGQDHWDGYVNVDRDPGAKADLVMDMVEAPRLFPTESVREVAMIHSLNYLPIWGAQQLFRDIVRILRPGGTLVIETVDVDKAMAKVQQHEGGDLSEYMEGVRAFHAFGVDTIERREDYAPNKMSWSTWHLTKELHAAGFAQVKVMEPRVHVHPDGVPSWRDMRVEATK